MNQQGDTMSNPAKVADGALTPFLDAADVRSQSLPEARKGGLDPVAVASFVERCAITLEAYEIAFDTVQRERTDLIAQGDRGAEATSVVAARTLEAAAHTVDEMLTTAGAEAEQIRESYAAEKQRLADALEAAKQESASAIAAVNDQLRTETAAAYAELAEMRGKLAKWRQEFGAFASGALTSVTEVFSNVQRGLASPLADGIEVPVSAESDETPAPDEGSRDASGALGLFSAES
jgi:hypothetical protein